MFTQSTSSHSSCASAFRFAMVPSAGLERSYLGGPFSDYYFTRRCECVGDEYFGEFLLKSLDTFLQVHSTRRSVGDCSFSSLSLSSLSFSHYCPCAHLTYSDSSPRPGGATQGLVEYEGSGDATDGSLCRTDYACGSWCPTTFNSWIFVSSIEFMDLRVQHSIRGSLCPRRKHIRCMDLCVQHHMDL